MATARLMATVLPHSVDPTADFHVSLFFTHRLDPGESDAQLADVPALVNWPEALRGATIALRVDGRPEPIACTPLAEVLSDAAWQAAFPATTPVTPFPRLDPTGAPWRSCPASALPEHALQAHYSSVFSSPVSPPTVSGSRLGQAVLDHLVVDGGELVGNVIDRLRRHERDRDAHRERIRAQQRKNAEEARDACACDDDEGAVEEFESAVGKLLGRGPTGTSTVEAFDAAVSRALDALVPPQLRHPPSGPGPEPEPGPGPGPDPGPALLPHARGAPDGVQRMLVDAHATQRYYHRPEERPEQPPPPRPVPGTRRDRPEDHAPDFHALAASAGNIPALARRLGLVLDLRVVDPQSLAAARTISCEVTVPGLEPLAVPETRCVAVGSAFLTATHDAQDQRPDDGAWSAGRLTVGTELYRVLDLDPDAAGLKLEQHLRGVLRAYVAELNGDPGNYAPATLRASGFAIAHTKRVESVEERVRTAQRHDTRVPEAGTMTGVGPFLYRDLVRGLRVEVWDDVTRTWHGLHHRTVDVDVDGAELLRGTRDVGLLQTASLTRAPGPADNPHHLHEVLAGWDGWSLSAPRPGKSAVHDSGQGPEPGSEMITNPADARPGTFRVHSLAAHGSLPALRYGRRYAFRVLGVDLAGNSVAHEMTVPTADEIGEAAVAAAAEHLAALRRETAERDAAGLLAAQRPGDPPNPSPSPGLVGRVHDAMVAIEQAAGSALITRPQLEVPPAEFAALCAGADGGPDTVTTPRPFLRWDRVPEPAIVPRRRYTLAESANRVVIRTTAAGAGTAERHLVPPKTSQLEAELDGCFDELMHSTDPAVRRRAYAIALKERGSLFSTGVQDLDDPRRLVPQPGVALESAPTADPDVVLTLADLQDPERVPAAGQYVVHDTDALVLPYLPDPMAHGVALVFTEAGGDHHLADRRVLQSVVVPYAGTWPLIEPLRLVVHSGPELAAVQRGNEIRVAVPPGEQVAMAVSSTLDQEHLARLGLWRFHAVHHPSVAEDHRLVLERAALDGWLWWLTPSTDLRLVNATPGPAKPPMITLLRPRHRTGYSVAAELDGVLDVHGASTEAVELRAEWDDLVDDPASAAPTRVTRGSIVTRLAIGPDERLSMLTVAEAKTGTRPSGVPERPVVHTMPDTRYRTVRYRLHGTSRYREFFEVGELPAPDDPATAGNVVPITHLSSAAPPPPAVHEVVPLFVWEEDHEPHHPFATRRIRRSGVRIWLDRPWHASGDDEMLGIVTHPAGAELPDGEVDAKRDVISLWGRDPALVGPAVPNATDLPLLPGWQQRALELAIDPGQQPGRPHDRIEVETRKGKLTHRFHAYLYRPEFHPDRRRWFVDAVFDAADAAWPFLRLNVVRYQPNSTPVEQAPEKGPVPENYTQALVEAAAGFSEFAVSGDVNTDFVQLLPERIATIGRPDAETVRVTVSGTFAMVAALTTPSASLTENIAASRTVRASLQTRPDGATSDLDWTTVAQVGCDLEGADPATFAATWSGALPLDAAPRDLATPGAEQNLRVLVEELEFLPADPEPGSDAPASSSRLVYADHLYL